MVGIPIACWVAPLDVGVTKKKGEGRRKGSVPEPVRNWNRRVLPVKGGGRESCSGGPEADFAVGAHDYHGRCFI